MKRRSWSTRYFEGGPSTSSKRTSAVVGVRVEVDEVKRRRALEELAAGDVDEHAGRGGDVEGLLGDGIELIPSDVRIGPINRVNRLEMHSGRGRMRMGDG